jgi:hypothetical protein
MESRNKERIFPSAKQPCERIQRRLLPVAQARLGFHEAPFLVTVRLFLLSLARLGFHEALFSAAAAFSGLSLPLSLSLSLSLAFLWRPDPTELWREGTGKRREAAGRSNGGRKKKKKKKEDREKTLHHW